jgi:hypothetical protein
MESPPAAGATSHRVLVWAAWVALALAVANAFAQAVDFGFFDLRYQTLNSNTHASLFGAASILACALAVPAAFRAAGAPRDSRMVVVAFLLVAILVLRVWQPPHVLVLALPLAAVVLVLLWQQGQNGARRTIRVGCLLLVASYAIHASETSAVGFVLNPASWSYQIRCVLKHDAEIAGWVLIAGGLLSLSVGRPLPSVRAIRPWRPWRLSRRTGP